MPKNLSLVFIFIFLVGCQNLKLRSDRSSQSGAGKATTQATNENADVDVSSSGGEVPEELPAPAVPTAIPKIGVILGGGGALTYAHIGALHELQKNKIPIHAIAGFEWASPMAALFANKLQANEVEWQMMKLKSEDLVKTSLLGKSESYVESQKIAGFIKEISQGISGSQLQIPFSCYALQIRNQKSYVVSAGALEKNLPLCMSYPPVLSPFGGYVADLQRLDLAIEQLKKSGANYIVLINPLGTKARAIRAVDSIESIMWSEVGSYYLRPHKGIDKVVSLPTDAYGMMDFEKRRELIAQGRKGVQELLKTLSSQFDL